MCDNRYNFAQPWTNNFYYHYLQQHAAMSYHFQKLHSNIHHYGNQFFDKYNPADVCNRADCCSSSSSCSCCSSRSCSETSSEYEEQEGMDGEEGNDEEQYEDEDCDEDESDCEYELNVDAILAMRAAKEELKKQEQAELKHDESSESKDGESEDSKDERESKSDSIVLVDSDDDDFEFIDLSKTSILDCNLYRRIGGFNKFEEEENKKIMMECLYGSASIKIGRTESRMTEKYDNDCDYEQPSLWPVLPLRL